MARFQHGVHDSNRSLSIQVVRGSDKRSPKDLLTLFIGKEAQVTMTMREAVVLRFALNNMRALDAFQLAEQEKRDGPERDGPDDL